MARVTPETYRNVGVALPTNAAVPSATVFDEGGARHDLRDMIERPTVLVFADYTCATLCGPVVAFVGAALEQSGLPADQYRLIVVGLDARDSAADAARMRRDHLGGRALNDASTFVTADQATVGALTSALGYRYAYDAEDDQFVHPAAAYVLRVDGHVARVLTGIGLSGPDMRLALVEAGQGKVGTLRDQVRLICSGFDPAHGTYNVMVSRLLMVSGLLTIVALAGGIVMLALMGRRRSA
jgi:protein SCO1/2